MPTYVAVFFRQPGLASPKVALANCLGMWWGCISPETPSLLYHTGGSRMVSRLACAYR